MLRGAFRRMWRYYLLANAGNFRARRNQVGQIVCSHDGIVGDMGTTRRRTEPAAVDAASTSNRRLLQSGKRVDNEPLVCRSDRPIVFMPLPSSQLTD
jgi:hypothetical protein